jgi:acetylornithine deacetylase
MDLDALEDMAVGLVRELIRCPSVSREEQGAADFLQGFMEELGLGVRRKHHNVWAVHSGSREKPVILLNSHLDTVKPVSGWARDPYEPQVEGDRIYGLGSNDAGGSLAALLACFMHYSNRQDLPYNLIFAATAEEEVSGDKGVACMLDELGKVDLGIVGEPTMNRMAVAEKGLMVIDGTGKGISAHAATGEGRNAIYEAIRDIVWLSGHRFERTSPWLGEVTMQVTMISAGTQHNVVPDRCSWVADVRTNEYYTNEEIFATIAQNLQGEAKARSFRLNPSFLPLDHPVVERGRDMGLESFGSMTLSDQALMSFPTLKIGPGDSSRSHTADEYIRTGEIRQGIEHYIQLLDDLQIQKQTPDP